MVTVPVRSGALEWIHVDCPLCGADDAEPVYERDHETGSTLGRLRKIDVLCRRCGFMYTDPRPSAADMRRYYAEASGASGSVFHAMEPGSRLRGLIEERAAFMQPLVASHFGSGPGAILDIGCATGDLLEHLDLPEWHKAGLEPSARASATARTRGLEVECGDLESTSLPDRSFDVITCISVLEHVHDLRASVGRIRQSLRPGGLAFVEVPDSTRPVAQIAEFFSFEHLSHFTRGTLVRCLAEAGLEAIAFDEQVGLPNLRVCARRSEQIPAKAAFGTDDAEALRRAIARYRRQREAFAETLTRRLNDRVDRWATRDARVAVYGAGMHTRFLMEVVDLGRSVTCLLDSDPRKAGSSFLGWRVFGPDDIPRLGLDAILISTNAFEEEVYSAIAPTARAHAIEVVRCYG
ncbi:MAG TPA: methyltransferase domain-containing protein [Deltaproteobacteria bacterium]|nr:methyltransferase domain-containing protein [Deltaproteobacteria bacterium]